MANIFVEERLELGNDLKAQSGPGFNTGIISLPSGQEKRNANWSTARRNYRTGDRTNNRKEYEYLLIFFMARQGRLTGFRLKDEGDYLATAVQSFWQFGVYSQGLLSPAAGNGTQAAFQLIKRYYTPSQSTDRVIKKPVSGTVVPYINGVAQTTGFTVDTSTGVVTFATAPASGAQLAADFTFDTPVRFDTDNLPQAFLTRDLYTKEAYYGVTPLPLVEVRV